MTSYKIGLLILGLWLCIVGISVQVAEATVTIHDVKINGQPISDVGSGAQSKTATACAEFRIGAIGGTTYGNFRVESFDGSQPARIEAQENGSACNASSHDKLKLINLRVVPSNQNAVNTYFTLEFSAHFEALPNGSIPFGGNMQGAFKPAGGSYGGCESRFKTWIFSEETNSETALSEALKISPPTGSFSVAIPSRTINVGTKPRSHRGEAKFKICNLALKLEVKGTDRFESTIHDLSTEENIQPDEPTSEKLAR